MKIVKVETLVCDGGWDPWSFLKLTTDEGLIGWSEFSEARSRRNLGMIVRQMAEQLIGQDPRNIGLILSRYLAEIRATSGGLQTLAIGAVENACLDIKAKALGVPVYELFGGAQRKTLHTYWSHCGMYRHRFAKLFEAAGQLSVHSLDDIRLLGREVREKGYKALKTNPLVMDPKKAGLVGMRSIELNVDNWIIDLIVDQIAAFRDGAGPDVRLLLDINFGYRTEGFKQIAKALEPFRMFWLEADTYEPKALADVRQSSTTPIASLEAVLGRRAIRPFLEAGSVDVGIIDLPYNGMTESYKMAALMDSYEVNVAAHNFYSRFGTMMSAQFCACIPNFRTLEIDVDELPWSKDLLTHPPEIVDGEYVLPNRPGWGSDINEEVARAHPYKG